MSFGMIIIMILGAGLAIATTGYLCVSIFAVIGYKLFRKRRRQGGCCRP